MLFVITCRSCAALIHNIEVNNDEFSVLSMRMIRHTLKLVTVITFQTRDGSHASRISTHIVHGPQLVLTRDELHVLGNSNVFQHSVTTTSNVSHVKVHAPTATIRISFG